MHQDESADYGVEIGGLREVVDGGATKFDVRSRDVSARKRQGAGIDVDCYDITLWTYQVSDNARDLTDTAAHVEYSHGLTDTCFLKSRARFFLVSQALSHETFVFGFRSSTIDVLLRLRHE